MKRRTIPSLLTFLVIFLAMSFHAWAADWPTSSYITYEPGTIPVIITVPHGGTESLAFYYAICGEYSQDINTIDLGQAISDAFEKRYPGARPYIIYNHLRRRFLDANRDPGKLNRETLLYSDDAAQGYTSDLDISIAPDTDYYAYICTGSTNVWTAQVAKDAWYVFDTYITKAKQDIISKGYSQILYIDLHSYVAPEINNIQHIQLGYGLLTEQYADGDVFDNNDKEVTSMRYLNSALSLEELIMGQTSFGNILDVIATQYYNVHKLEDGAHDYKSIPSASLNPSNFNSTYYGGGFNTHYNTIVDYRCNRIPYSYDYYECDETNSIAGHGQTSGLQIEIPRDYIKYDHDGADGRKHLSRVLVDTIAAYLTTHYNYRLDGSSSSVYPRQGTDTSWPL